MNNYTVSTCCREDIKAFIEQHHYSHNINGVMASYCFKLLDKDNIVGAAIFGKLGMANAWKKYANNIDDVIELRRLVLIDDTVRNAESFFIGKMLKFLVKNTNIKTVVSYADPNNGHTGVVYRASNFKFIGMTSAGRVIIYGDKQYHDKAIRTTYKGELKPFAKKLQEALETGEASYKKTIGKYIYLYDLERRR